MRPYILCVDDERDATDLLRFLLVRAGYEARVAASGREALTAVRAQQPDLIILDLMLPDIDGFGFLEILRQEPTTAQIPVVLLTGWATPDARAHGLALGALDYLTKPFSPLELITRLQRLLARRAELVKATA